MWADARSWPLTFVAAALGVLVPASWESAPVEKAKARSEAGDVPEPPRAVRATTESARRTLSQVSEALERLGHHALWESDHKREELLLALQYGVAPVRTELSAEEQRLLLSLDRRLRAPTQ